MGWPKGKPRSEETKNKISSSTLGERNHFFGKSHSVETKRMMSNFAKTKLGSKNSNYGNRGSLNPLFGKKATNEHRDKQSKALKGRVFSREWKDKLSKIAQTKIGPQNNFYGKRHSDSAKQIMRDKRKDRILPKYDTKPERMMQLALTLHGIKFERQKLFRLGKTWHRVDIFIEPNICVEVDGVHWHIELKDVRRDLFQTQELTVMGYHVIRIRDRDILKNIQNCAETVIKLIKELQFRFISGP